VPQRHALLLLRQTNNLAARILKSTRA
jgi:hypothetical protein